MLAVVQGASSCQWVTEGSQSSPLLQALLPFGRAAYFQAFRFCPRDQELLQFLANFRRQAKFLDDLLGNWLLPVFRTLHCLFQWWLRHPCNVPGPIGPRSPTEAAHLSEPMRHQTLGIHQPDTCPRICLIAEMIHLLVDSLLSFMGCFMCCCHSLPFVLWISDDSFIDSQTLMSLFYGHGNAEEKMFCVQAKSSATMNTCDAFSRDLHPRVTHGCQTSAGQQDPCQR